MKYAKIALRLSLSASFLSAVADRFGLWGSAGSQGVVWGNYQSFLDYTQFLNPWAPKFLIPYLGGVVTGGEVILAIFLLIGYKLKESAYITCGLLSLFIFGMIITGGIKGPLDYSVFTAASASFLLGIMSEHS